MIVFIFMVANPYIIRVSFLAKLVSSELMQKSFRRINLKPLFDTLDCHCNSYINSGICVMAFVHTKRKFTWNLDTSHP